MAPKGSGHLLSSYRYDAKRKGIFWGLTQEQFLTLTKANCHYCGAPPTRIHRKYLFNGIDRVDNSRGYDLSNCVTACWTCNKVKGKSLSYDEMISVGRVLGSYRSGKT